MKTNSRGLALLALRKWRTGEQFADAILAHLLGSSGLNATDRAFATELFYGVLRNLMLLDFWIARLRSGRLDHDTRDLLRLGLYQLFLLKTPAHAAVFETVELAASKSRSLANAVLRSATRSRVDLLREANKQPLSIRKSHPQFLIDRWRQHFRERNTETLCDWNNRPAPLYARINRLKISDKDFLVGSVRCFLEGSARCADRTPQPGVPTNFLPLIDVPHEALAAGHCYIQDPSTAAACVLLDPKPGDRVLDACAAPGGKTAYLAELMKNHGFILACDRDAVRVKTLRDNLERLGVAIAQCTQHDWLSDEPISAAPASFDRILIDAPCTNTGVMRRRVDVRWRLAETDFARMQRQQLAILLRVIPLLKPTGVLVYSTCSLESEENEQVLGAILKEFPFLKNEEEFSSLPFRDGFDGAYAAKLSRA